MGLWNWFLQKEVKDKKAKEYSVLVSGMVKDDFPSLKNKKISIKRLKKSRYTAKIVPIRSRIIIKISKRMDKYTLSYNKAVIAHELSHMEDWLKRSWFYFSFVRPLMLNSEKYVTAEENRADKIAIQRGYAKALYNQRKSRFKSKNPKDKKIMRRYTHPEEIKDYAKLIGKWK